MSSDTKIGVEIEKKYIIEKPSFDILAAMPSYTVSDILQIYLTSERGQTRRIRRRSYKDKIHFYETTKIRIDRISSTEMEREISEAEFLRLSELMRKDSHPIHKTRHTFIYKEQLFEIDIYPQWRSTAILETELETRDTTVEFPPFIKVVRDLTGNKNYSNASMAKKFPDEETSHL